MAETQAHRRFACGHILAGARHDVVEQRLGQRRAAPAVARIGPFLDIIGIVVALPETAQFVEREEVVERLVEIGTLHVGRHGEEILFEFQRIADRPRIGRIGKQARQNGLDVDALLAETAPLRPPGGVGALVAEILRRARRIARRVRIEVVHVHAAGLREDFQRRIGLLQPFAEGPHTHDAAGHDRRIGLDARMTAENFGIGGIHPPGQPPVLHLSLRRQIAGAPFQVRIDRQKPVAGVDSPRRQLAVGARPAQHLGHVVVLVVREDVTGAVAAVVADVERLVPFRSRRRRRRIEGVHEIDPSGLVDVRLDFVVGALRTGRCGQQQDDERKEQAAENGNKVHGSVG